MNVVYYNPDKDCYSEKDIRKWQQVNKFNLILELHKNGSRNNNTRGTGILLSSKAGLENEQIAKKVLNDVLLKYFTKWSDGIVIRNDIYNTNQTLGLCKYLFIEICFNSNGEDNRIYDENVNNIGSDIFITLEKLGIKKLGVIYGHGGKDVGTVNGTRYERDEVRRMKIEPLKDDLISEWAKDGWEWVIKNMLMDGTRPKHNLTREELATVLYRYDKFKG